ncbi:MAG: TasA family protein [Coriobacteriia bacterium]
MSKKILLSILTIVVAVGLVGVGTYAMWSDAVESQDNEFSSGTLYLEVNGNDSDFAGVVFENAKPGDSTTYTFYAKNAGSIDASELKMKGTFANEGAGTLASVLYVTSLKVDDAEQLTGDVAISGFSGTELSLGALGAGGSRKVEITIWMDDAAEGNMGETVLGDVMFTLNQ